MPKQQETPTPRKYICTGLLAHVDSGKTTLAEGLLYRAGALRRILDEAVAALGSVRGVGVRRVLRALALERVSVDADVCRDIDTPEDVAWWQDLLGK